MSLFIGNLPRDANEKDLHDLFDKVGDCTFRFKVRFYIYHQLTLIGQLRIRRLQGREGCGEGDLGVGQLRL